MKIGYLILLLAKVAEHYQSIQLRRKKEKNYTKASGAVKSRHGT
jgi:hypothetical protein